MTKLVDPPIAAFTLMAFSKASFFKTSESFKFSATISTIRRPDNCAKTFLRESAAGIAAFSGDSLTNVDPESLAGGLIGPGVGFVIFIPIILMSVWSKSYLQARIRNYVFSKIKLADRIRFTSELKVKRLFWIYLSNLFLLIITLGFAYPWTKIRLAKYKLETLSLAVWGDLDGFVTQMGDRRNALGEELGDAFDLDIGLGI